MPFLVRDLIAGRPSPITISADAKLVEAHQKMDEHDFTQLPVIGKDQRLAGLITSESMLRTLTTFKESIDKLRVHDAVLPVRPFNADGDLFQLLQRFADEYAVVVVDENEVVGIVTAFDTSSYFRKRAEDTMLVEEIERTLREFILLAFSSSTTTKDNKELHNAVQRVLAPQRDQEAYKRSLAVFCRESGEEKPKLKPEAVNKAFDSFASAGVVEKSFDEIGFNETIELFLSKDRWDLYASVIPLSPNAIRNMLIAVRDVRNKLAHFKGEVTGSEHQSLVQCRNWLYSHRDDLYLKFKPQQLSVSGADSTNERNSPESQNRQADGADITRWANGHQQSKYRNLYEWLVRLPTDLPYTWTSFDKIESIIGANLPPSARKGQNWWANDSTTRVQSREWLKAGFRVDEVDLVSERVLFRRNESRPTALSSWLSKLKWEDLVKTPETADDQSDEAT